MRLPSWVCCVVLLCCAGFAGAPFCRAQSPATTGILNGSVADPSGAVIPNAVIHVETHKSSAFVHPNTTTDATGSFTLKLPAGAYDVTIISPGFDPLVRTVTVRAGAVVHLNAALDIATLAEIVNVPADFSSSTSAADNRSAMDFKSTQLQTFSDDDATFQQQILAIAGGDPSAPPNIYVDGFSGGQFPPKNSIREIRINQNPYSAQYPEIGFGRVEIFTKPGSGKLHGNFDVFGNDAALNSLDPYTGLQPPYYSLIFQGNLSGPIGKKTSFFLSGVYNDQQNNSVVNTDASPQSSTPVSQAVSSPTLLDDYIGRLDRQITPVNTFTARYEFNRVSLTNGGLLVAQTLPTQAYNSATTNQTLQLSDTQTIGAKMISETHFQYIRTRLDQDPISTAPALTVEGYFNGGGSSAQTLHDNQDHYEFQEYFSLQHGSHFLRAGGRYRSLRDANLSTAGYNGQFIYPNLSAFTSGTPSQFTITTGQSSAVVVTGDLGVYAEDEWKARRNLTLDYGFRFETQSAIPDHFDPAPRVGLAWGVGQTAKKPAIVMLRTGFGLFYDRFPSTDILTAIRQQSGTRQTSYTVQNPQFNAVPPAPFLSSSNLPTLYNIDPHLRSEYDIDTGLTAERTFGRKGSVTANYIYLRSDHQWNSRNINAPLPGTYLYGNSASGVRPLGTTQNIYQFTSEGIAKISVLFANAQVHPAKFMDLWVFYMNRHKNTDTSGPTSFPTNQYDVSADFGRALVQHQRLFTGATIRLPHGFMATPFFSWQSSMPFNITTGTDLNGDTQYNDRPSFATASSPAGSVYKTPYGTFNALPQPGETIIPVNYGNGPGFLYLELGMRKIFQFGPLPPAPVGVSPTSGQLSAAAPKPIPPYSLMFSFEADNILNHVNAGPPIGVLSSPQFGKSIALSNPFNNNPAANRMITLHASFSF